MINAVYEILKPLKLPCRWNGVPDFKHDKTVISYHFFAEAEAQHGDGDAIESGGSLQLDVYSKGDYTRIVNMAKSLLKNAGFMFFEGRDDTEEFDKNTMLYHKILIFNYLESEVLK